MTFVLLQTNNAAPQSSPARSSPIDDKAFIDPNDDDYLPMDDYLLMKKRSFKLQLGGIGGKFGDNEPKNWQFTVAILKKKEISFERFLIWGFGLTSNQMLELKAQADLWGSGGLGFSQFIIGRDGIANLINVNQSKIVLYGDLGSYFQLQALYGLTGLAYSVLFQTWF